MCRIATTEAVGSPRHAPHTLLPALFASLPLNVTALRLSLFVLPALAIFTVAYEQGQLGAFIGMPLAGNSFLHELFHDLRHVAGFMCH